MKARVSSIQSGIFAFQVAGFPAIAAITTLLGISNTNISLASRGLIVIAAISVILFRPRTQSTTWSKNTFTIALVFWFLYIGRLCEQTIFNTTILSRPYLDYWIWAIGGALIPFIAIAKSRPTNTPIRLWGMCISLTTLAALIILLKGTTMAGTDSLLAYDSERLRLDTLNPISVGHVGATLVILSFWYLIEQNKKVSVLLVGTLTCLSLLGLGLLALSASRGPIVSLLVAVIFYLITRLTYKNILRIISALAACSVLATALLTTDTVSTERVSKRVNSMLYGEDQATNERTESYSGAIETIFRSPIIGSDIEEPNTGNYPHNLFLEAGMSTGLIGAGLLVWFTVRILGAARTLLMKRSLLSWTGLLFIQYFLGAMFSGAIYSITTFWAVSAFIVCIRATETESTP